MQSLQKKARTSLEWRNLYTSPDFRAVMRTQQSKLYCSYIKTLSVPLNMCSKKHENGQFNITVVQTVAKRYKMSTFKNMYNQVRTIPEKPSDTGPFQQICDKFFLLCLDTHAKTIRSTHISSIQTFVYVSRIPTETILKNVWSGLLLHRNALY